MHLTRNIYQVHEITQILQVILQSEPTLRDLWIEGEISNFARPSSGHIYFTLKDDDSQIRCAIFRPDASRLRFPLKNGDAVLVHGRLSIYDVRSEYQIIGDRVEPAGVGALRLAFERLKEQLAAAGMFDEARKKPLPKFPQNIGVITSATGAAIRDILRMLQKRYPIAEVLLFPTLVQGEGAAAEIAHAIACMNCLPNVDLLIVGRGGGSMEDLWTFNEEVVARAIFGARIPVISAVGHETDFTIADLVADHRAPTPTAAIEHAVPDQQELRRQVSDLQAHLVRSVSERIDALRARLASTQSRLSPTRQRDFINRFQQTVDHLEVHNHRIVTQRIVDQRQYFDRLNGDLSHLKPTSRVHKLGLELNQLMHTCQLLGQKRMDAKIQALQAASSRLDTLSPLATLARGYSVCKDSQGDTITDTSQVNAGDEIQIQLSRGALTCSVLEGEKHV